jgi:hypothetical protein
MTAFMRKLANSKYRDEAGSQGGRLPELSSARRFHLAFTVSEPADRNQFGPRSAVFVAE